MTIAVGINAPKPAAGTRNVLNPAQVDSTTHKSHDDRILIQKVNQSLSASTNTLNSRTAQITALAAQIAALQAAVKALQPKP